MLSKSKAFSLIELLVVLSIITILTTLSVMSYQAYVLKSYRSEVVALILYLANKQEQYYANWGYYSDNFSALGSDALVLVPRYKLTLAVSQQGHGYEIVAQATGAQIKDGECLRLTFNHVGQRNNNDHKSQRCWQ